MADDEPIFKLPDDVIVRDLPEDLTIIHNHFDGMCTKMGYSKKEDAYYFLESKFSIHCDEEPTHVGR